MSNVLKVLGILILLATGVGFYFRQTGDLILGDRIIGISVLATSFILLPLFLYHRWKGKRLKDYTLSEENLKKMKEGRKDKKG